MTSKEKRLAINTAIIAIGNTFTKCVSFFMLPLYTALLTAEQYGEVDFAEVLCTLLVAVFSLQLQQGLLRYLVESRGDRQKEKTVISTATLFMLLVLLGFVAIMLVTSWVVTYEYILLIMGIVLASVSSNFILQIARGFGDNVTYSIGSCIAGSSRVLLNVLCIAVLRMDVRGMLYAYGLSYVIALIFLIFKVKLWRYISIRFFDKAILIRLLRFSMPLVFSTMCWWAISAFGRMQVNLVLGASAAGIYAVANKFPTTFTMVTNIFYTSWTESAAENVDDEKRNAYYHSILDKAIRFYSSANLGIIAVMPFLFPVLVNGSYDEARAYIPIMMTASLLSGVANLFASVYTALKRTREIAWTTIAATVLSVVINVTLIPVIGLYAAALSLLVANGLIALIQYLGVVKMVEYRLPWRLILSEGVMYAMVFAAYYFGNTLLQGLALVVLIPYCVYQNWHILKAMVTTLLKKLKR